MYIIAQCHLHYEPILGYLARHPPQTSNNFALSRLHRDEHSLAVHLTKFYVGIAFYYLVILLVVLYILVMCCQCASVHK